MATTFQHDEKAGSEQRSVADHTSSNAITHTAVPALRKMEDEDNLQIKADAQPNSEGEAAPLQRREDNHSQAVNKTGLPGNLKAGIENLSGISLDDVKVHYNSDKPEQLNALAYAHGTEIHVGSGQERHLPHEAWHVVQQKQGRVNSTKQLKSVDINDDSHLEKEADIMGERAVKMPLAKKSLQLKSVNFGRTAIQRKVYGNLSGFEKAKVDVQVDKTYHEKAMEYEQLLGKKFATATESEEIVDKILAIVKKIVNAYHANSRTWFESLKTVYEREFRFDEGDKYFGAFKMTGTNIERIFESLDPLKPTQPIRKKLKVIYNAVRNNNIAKWLKIASDGMEGLESQVAHFATGARNKTGDDTSHKETIKTGFAPESGLAKILTDNPAIHNRVKAASKAEKANVKTTSIFGDTTELSHVSAPDAFSGIARGTAAEASKMDIANRDRLYNQNRGVPLKEQQTITNADIPDLTDEEILMIKERRGEAVSSSLSREARTAFKAKPGDKIAWEQGREAIMVMFNSKVEKDAESLRARLEAGISGSTGMMFAAAKNLGINTKGDLQKLRIAMLGWMLPNHDHSFYEIMMAADYQGLPFITDPGDPGKQYEEPQNFAPIDVSTLKPLLPEKEFPRYFLSNAYKDTLADTVAQTPGLDSAPQHEVVDPLLSLEEATKKRYKTHVTALGLQPADTETLNERGLLEVIALNESLKATSFADETVSDPAKVEQAKAINKLRFHQLRTQPPFRYLQHTYAVHAELWMAQLLNKLAKPCHPDHTLLLAVDPAKLPATDANLVARKKVLEDNGAPAYLLDAIPEHLINDLVSLNAIIDKLGLDSSKPIAHPDNDAKYKSIFRTSFAERLFSGYDRQQSNLLIAFMCKKKYGALLGKSLFDSAMTTPESAAMLALGIPDKMVRILSPDPQAQKIIGNIEKAITSIAAKGVPQQIPELKNLAVTFDPLKKHIDKYAGLNSFDMIVAAIATKKGLDLKADKHLETLGRIAGALNTTEAIVSPGKAESGFGDFSLNSAKETLENNLATEHTNIAATPFNNLTAVEIASINAYSKLGGMGAWQAALWTPDTTSKTANDKPVKLAPKIQSAVAGLRKLPSYAGPVYNAQRTDLKGNPAQALKVFARGTIHHQNNFLSTSVNVADSFIPKAEYGVAWTIGSGHKGKNIAPLSTNYGEKEVLFAPGSSFVVTKVEDKTTSADPADYNKVWVWVEEI